MTMAHPSRRMFVRQAGLAGLALSAGAIPAWALPDAWFAADDEVIPFTDVPADFSTKRGDTVVTYCMVGYRASMTYFAARYLGLPVKLYDGSYEDWLRRGLPLVTGPAP